jgi:signal transduction histidine kinase
LLALTTLGALILGWFAAGRVLAPLRSITATARTISAGNLHQRLALTGPDDEFKQLGDTLDELLGRLEASFDAQRRFVANASHELRTPMTLERTLLQVALADPDADAERLRETCRELLTSQAEHERLLDGLLTLASSERGLDRHAALDLAKLAGTVVAAAGERPEPGVPHLTAVLDPAPCHGDQALLVRLIANLIDNATEHNVPDGSVTIHTGMQDGAATIAVQNTGPVIRPEQVEPLFEPFRRLGPERTGTGGHYGLGLSIVRAITVAHGATVTAVAQATGGLVVRVRFPPTP